MIDEELYQQAADELNTDSRKAHIWARACALASDDHDEARYLYTNLRVEELIAERESAVSSATQQAAQPVENDKTLALEPLSRADNGVVSSSETSAQSLDDDSQRVTDDSISQDGDTLDGDSLSLHDDTLSVDVDDQQFRPESVSAPSGVDRSDSPDDDFLQLLADTDQLDEPAIASKNAGFEERIKEHFEQQAVFKPSDDTSPNFTADSSADPDAEPAADATPNADGELVDAADSTADTTIQIEFANALAEDKSLEDDFLDSYEEHQENIKAAAREETAEDFISSLDMTNPDLESDLTLDASLDEQQLDSDSATELNLNPDEIAGYKDSSARTLSSIHGGELADGENQMDTGNLDNDGELPGRQQEDSLANLPAMPSETRLNADGGDDRLAQELERQADQLPGQRDDVIEHTDLTADTQEAAFVAQSVTQDDVQDVSQNRSEVVAANTAHDAQASEEPSSLPVDLSAGERGKKYAIYKRDAWTQAVNTGVSWSALFFTLPFLIYRHLFGTAIMYALLWIISLGGLLITGLAWLDAGVAASTLIKAGTIGFASLAVVGLLYIPFRYGNIWRCEKLESRGFELIAWVRASNSGKALTKARRAAALD